MLLQCVEQKCNGIEHAIVELRRIVWKITWNAWPESAVQHAKLQACAAGGRLNTRMDEPAALNTY